jgi:hypothetical protein
MTDDIRATEFPDSPDGYPDFSAGAAADVPLSP